MNNKMTNATLSDNNIHTIKFSIVTKIDMKPNKIYIICYKINELMSTQLSTKQQNKEGIFVNNFIGINNEVTYT